MGTRLFSARSRYTRWIIGAVLVVGLGACVTVPLVEYNSYREAIRAAKESSQAVLVDLRTNADFLQSEIDRAKAVDETGTRKFVAPAPTSVTQAAPMTVADRLAIQTALWEALVRFNEALTYLAEGRSAEQLKASIGEFSTAVQSLVLATESSIPLLGPILAIGGDLIEEAERAQDRKEFIALVKGRGGDLVAKVIIALQQEADQADVIARAAAIGRVDELFNQATEEVLPEIRDLLTPLDPTVKTADIQADIDQTIALIQDIEGRFIALSDRHQDGRRAPSPVFDPATDMGNFFGGTDPLPPVLPSQISQFVEKLEGLEHKSDLTFRQYVQENRVIAEHKRLLDAISVAMESLRRAAGNKVDTNQLAARISTLALSLKGHWAEVKAIQAAN